MGDRCTGACCMAFPLPEDPGGLWKRYDHWLRHRHGLQQQGDDDVPLLIDIHIIAPMVEYLGYQTTPMYEVAESARALTTAGKTQPHWYRCKLFDQDTRLCTIYERRPRMCRDYPYGKPCEYAACEWDGAAQGHEAEEMTSG